MDEKLFSSNVVQYTDVGLKEFEANLLQSGYADVTTQNAARNGVKLFRSASGDSYSIRPFSSSTKGPTAEYFPSGSSSSANLKIRLGGE